MIPLLACRNAIEWTNGVMNTLLAISREIPSGRTSGDYFQQTSSTNERGAYEQIFELIQTSIQEIILRYNSETKTCLILIKKYLELQSQFQYSQSNLLQILTKQQIMYSRQVDNLSAGFQQAQLAASLSSTEFDGAANNNLNNIPPGNINLMGSVNGVGGFFHSGGTSNSNRFSRDLFNPRSSSTINSVGDTNDNNTDFGDGGGNYAYGNNYNSHVGSLGFNFNAGVGRSHHQINNQTHINMANNTINAFRATSVVNQTPNGQSHQNHSLKATQPQANRSSAIVDLAGNTAYIAVEAIGSDSETNEPPPPQPHYPTSAAALPQHTNKDDSAVFLAIPAPVVQSKNPTVPLSQNPLQQLQQPLSHPHFHQEINLDDLVPHHLPSAPHPGGSATMNIHSASMSGLSPSGSLLHSQYFNQQYNNHILAGTTISAASAAALSAPPALEPNPKPKKAPPKRAAASKVPKNTASEGTEPTPPKRSNRGMLAISKPDPNSLSGMMWDSSLSAAEQLKLLKAEKIKNELNKKIAAIPDSNEFDASLGAAIVPLPRPIIFNRNAPLPSSLKSIIESNEPRKRSFAALTEEEPPENDHLEEAADDDAEGNHHQSVAKNAEEWQEGK